MHRYKTNWDYFCELIVAIPGLTAMFSDSRTDTPSEASFRKSLEAEERSRAERQWSDAPGDTSGARTNREKSEERGSTSDALVEGVESMGETLEDGAREAARTARKGAEKMGAALKGGFKDAKEFIREHA